MRALHGGMRCCHVLKVDTNVAANAFRGDRLSENELAPSGRFKRPGNPLLNYVKSAWPAFVVLILGFVLVATAEGPASPALTEGAPAAAHANAAREAGGDLLQAFFREHHIVHTIWKEGGFAMIISALTWLVFDFALRTRADDENERRLNAISKNVLHAVLGQRIGRGLVDEIDRVNFSIQFVRSFMNVQYTLRDASCTHDAAPMAYVELESRVEFEVENVGTEKAHFMVGTALPDPVHEALRAVTDVTRMTARRVGAESDEVFDLDKGRTAFREAMKGEAKSQVRFDAGSVLLQPEEKLLVYITSILPKELEDSELLEMGYPTGRLSVMLTDTKKDSLRTVRIRSVHRVSRAAKSDRGSLNLTIENWTLRNQGVYLWWKVARSG